MPSKYELLTMMLAEQVKGIVTDTNKYIDYLDTAAHMYKYNFREQLLIYAQKPGATACADIDTWNKLGRWVNKGTKGIALLDDTSHFSKLRHVFDVSDTNSRAGQQIFLWKLEERYEPYVTDSLVNSFGDVNDKYEFAQTILDTAENIVADNITDYKVMLSDLNDNSLVSHSDYKEENFQELVVNSVTYILLTRCGYAPLTYYGTDSFDFVTYFDSFDSVLILGKAVTEISQMALREIESTVKDLRKQELLQNRTFDYYSEKRDNKEKEEKEIEYGTDIQTAGRLSNTKPDNRKTTGNWEIWNVATHISAQPQRTDIYSNDAERHVEQPSGTDRFTGTGNDGTANIPNEGRTEYHRTVESGQSDAMGADDEQYIPFSRRDSVEPADLQLEPLPAVEEQISNITQAETEKVSAFSISQEVIDAIIKRGSGVSQGKMRIYAQYLKKESKEDNIKFLKNEYGWGGAYPAFASLKVNENHDAKGIHISLGSIMTPDAEVTLSWKQVEKRIGELIEAQRYLNTDELDRFPHYIREKRERDERWEIAKDIRKVVSDYNALLKSENRIHDTLDIMSLNTAVSNFGSGNKTVSVASREEFVLLFLRDALRQIADSNTEYSDKAKYLIVALNSDKYTHLEPTYDELNPPPKEYVFSLGDKIYIGTQDYELLYYDNEIVRLYDPSFPLITKEISRAEFDAKVKENPINDKYLQIATEDLLEFIKDNGFYEYQDTLEVGQTDEDFVEVIKETLENEPEVVTDYINETAIELTEPTEKRIVKNSSSVLYPEIPDGDRRNFVISGNDLGVGTSLERYRRNILAIKLLKVLEERKELANHDEQIILSQYVGWGGLADYFDEKNPHYLELKELLTEDEYESARESTLTAFFTPPVVIKVMYSALSNMNFKRGNILEPSCGVGNFIGMLPDNMSDSKIYGVELDSISGRIAQQLYQKSSIAIQGFETTNLPDSFFDIAIGNVPFGQFKVSDKRYDKHNFLIHDYFFAKTLDKVRPGGVIAFITSSGTMDKTNPKVRKYIAQRADLLGAIRLPNNTFKDAAGTTVTSDILFLQKRDKLIDIEADWAHLGKDKNGYSINQYFVDNPDMILGEMKEISGPFGPELACVPYEGVSLESQLDSAIQNIHAEITEYEFDEQETDENVIPADPNVRNFSYTLIDGQIYYRENSLMKPIEASVTAQNRIKGLIAIRDCVRTLIEYQTEDYPEEDISFQQKELNRLYDEFSNKYGLINSRANNSAFNSDSSYFLLTSLEVLDDEGNFIRKADMFSKRTIKKKVIVTSVDTASEALALSLSEKATIDMEYMSQLTGKAEEQLFEELKGVIFQNPVNNSQYKYLTAEEYLSGNVREKLRFVKGKEEYKLNEEALQKVQPIDLTASEISVRLGSTWLPVDVVSDFMFHIFSTPRYMRYNIKVHFSEYTGEWNIEGKSYDRGNVRAYNTYGTNRINGYKILEDTLNLRDVRIFDYHEDENGKRVPVLNKQETAIAQGKQQLLKQAFLDWVWEEPYRRERLVKLYNEKFNSIRPREYDGSHLNFVGMNPEITLRKHQVNAIARIIYGGNTLLGHVVGAGKTFEMVAAAMESKRLGLCSKSLFVVPNHLTEQWASEFLQLYPSANILVATKKDFETKNRKKFCGRIATGDYDAIIIGHSQFEKIPISLERQRTILEKQMEEIIQGISELKFNRGDRFSVKQLEKTKKSIKTKLDKLNDHTHKDDAVTFEELGVDRVFIDEAHYYKNLAAFSKMRNVGGISQTEAMKSSDLYMKCRYLDEITNGKGIIFATGTPISNSMVEMYTMQKYLQYNALSRNSLLHFDSWASTFGETVTAIELAPEGTGYRAKTRFSRFYNLPELMSIFKEVADIQTADMLNLPVPKANYHNVVLKPSEHQKDMVKTLSERAEKVRNKMVNSSEDNMLLITNDGRKLALDQRLINDMLPDSDTGKTASCADNVYDIWEKTKKDKLTQMIFCDLSTPHNDGKFNVYDDIRKKLIDKGIPEEEIAFIHNAKTEVHKKEMFGKVRSGQIRVLIGSTQKMGAGTNVQHKLIALHHLDCPWRPSDLQQREGRIIRQGNTNPEVDIFTYVTENTFDSYLYQMVENKQKFIGQIMTSKSPVRSAEDIDETALSYAEIKALCTGNPYIKEKMDLDIDVQRLKLLKANHLSQKYALEDSIIKIFPQQIKRAEQKIQAFENDVKLIENTPVKEDEFSPMLINGNEYTEKKEAGTQLLLLCKAMTTPEMISIGSYRNFNMYLEFDVLNREYVLSLKGDAIHKVGLGNDIFGNLQRIDNLIKDIPKKLEYQKAELENILAQFENAKVEVTKPFPQEQDLNNKIARLNELNVLLNLEKRENEIVEENEIQNEDMLFKERGEDKHR